MPYGHNTLRYVCDSPCVGRQFAHSGAKIRSLNGGFAVLRACCEFAAIILARLCRNSRRKNMSAIALPLFGRLGDKFGNFPILLIASIGAIFSIFAITNLAPVGIWVAVLVTTSYFVVASGRNVPATTMVTAVVKAENRGSFMSVRTSAQQLALGSSSLLAGVIVGKDANGALINYEIVGYIAIGMSILAVILARYLKVVKE